MASQPASLRKCASCNHWSGARQVGTAPGTVAFDEANASGLCVDGPWHGTERRARSACGRWIVWMALEKSDAGQESPPR